jgi:hypothetical protein
MKTIAAIAPVCIMCLFISCTVFAQCTLPDASAIQLLAPNGRSNSLAPAFSWTAAPNMGSASDYYELYLWDAEDSTHPIAYPVTVYGTSWQMPGESLSLGHTYAWKVKPINTCGAGNDSAVVLFYAASSPVYTTTTIPATTTTVPASTTTTTTPGGGFCAMSFVLGAAGHDGELNLLRQYRDRVLLKTPQGRQYIAWYYKHSLEVVQIIRNNPTIREEMMQALHAVLLDIDSILRDNADALSPEAMERIQSLCAAIESEASAQLIKDIERFRNDLDSGKLPDCIVK